MKLVMAIMNNDDSNTVIPHITEAGFSVTSFATMGGFLQTGNTTLLIGTEDDRTDELKKLLERFCSKRKKVSASTSSFGKGLNAYSLPEEVTTGGVSMFVLSIDKLEKI